MAANKRPKQESTSPIARPANLDGRDGELPGAQAPSTHSYKAVEPYSGAFHSNKPSPAEKMLEAENTGPLGQDSYASPPAFQAYTPVPKEVDSVVVPSQPTVTLVSPPTSQADETDVRQENADGEGENPTAIHTPTSSSRHSSRQPRHVERYVPEVQISVGKPTKSASHPSLSSSSSTRHASFVTSATACETPPGLSKKPTSRPTSSHAKKSVSPAATTLSPGHQSSKNTKRERADNMDADSLRLIRQLQEAEFGLRKRTSRA